MIFLAKEKLNMFLPPRDPEKTLGELQTEEEKRGLGKSAAASWLCCLTADMGSFLTDSWMLFSFRQQEEEEG